MLNQLNIFLFKIINNFAGHNNLLDNIGIVLAEYLPYVFILTLLYLWLQKNKIRDIILYSGYATILGLIINHLITLVYFHPRPFMDHLGTTILKHAPDSSFPSDHTTLLLSIAFMFLYFRETRTIGIILSGLGILGGLARVYVGVHYPLDIASSIIVSLISTSLFFYLQLKLLRLNKPLLNFYEKIFSGKK